MEHEVFVPFPAESVRQVLADPDRLARCLPGLQQDASEPAEPGTVSGRLKVRVGSTSITYRGTLRVTGSGAAYTAQADGAEARGTGSVKLALGLTLAETPSGTALTFTGTASGDGRLAELGAEQTESAGRRLLDRFGTQLAQVLEESSAGGEPGTGAGATGPEEHGDREEAEEEALLGAESEAEAADVADVADVAQEEPAERDWLDEAELEPEAGEDPSSVFEAEVPPSSLDPLADDEEPPAEAAHARRTMIGRSAEEVDHAPPRGRYAPVPAPETVSSATATLRWAAPAAALAVASAVLLARALRRRR
ncbi:SRPBCC domain-containing protein [Streptomyces sp. GC420]|uniref:SRPBCC domain-containing protein n=1 Tax=Streptomyces sp. GC420 TaxID=2697568 RepID=UPI0014151712|nr:SRPBCC domain-containing protein [Streptomyces sp. GC420]NBM16865.1 carbon monoxide dehydrogenase [Streptomyces sp. GC420]